MRLRSYELASASRFWFSRKIRRPATFDFCNTICHYDNAPQHNRLKKKDRQRDAAVSPKPDQVGRVARSKSGLSSQAARAASIFRFLFRPSIHNAPRPVAKSGNAAGRGAGLTEGSTKVLKFIS